MVSSEASKWSGARMLWLIRDGYVEDWKQLLEHYGLDPQSTSGSTDLYALRQCLDSLEDAGLVRVEENRPWTDTVA